MESISVSPGPTSHDSDPFDSTPLFAIHDARVRREGKDILKVDDFVLNQGEHIALLGPNGAGKSTFIKLLTREVLPLYRDNPPVRFMGNPRPSLVDIRRYFGVVSATMQDQVSVHLPAREIVCGGLFGTLGVPAEMNLKPTQEQWSRTMQVMEELGIGSLAGRDVLTLSSGQLRRVLVARELVSNPQALIFDEPCTGLDPEGMYYLRETMRKLAAAGKSIIVVTHYPEDIIPAVKRVLLIKDAAIYADGSKDEILVDEVMTKMFGVPIAVEHRDGWYSLRGVYE